MIKILFVYEKEFDPISGGIERVTTILSKALLEKGYLVEYLVLNRSNRNYEYISIIPTFYFPEKLTHIEKVSFYQKILTEHSIDIVINQSGTDKLSKLFLDKGSSGAKIISCMHLNPLRFYNSFAQTVKSPLDYTFKYRIRQFITLLCYPLIKYIFKKRMEKVYKLLFEKSDAVCFLSSRFKNELKTVYKGNLNKVHFIPNPNTFSKEETDMVENKKKQIIYVGRLIAWQKQPLHIINIWSKISHLVPDWNLIIVGDGPERNKMEWAARKINNIKFVGFQNPLPYYKESSIIALTSSFEGWGMCLTEAMQFGVVPIAYSSYQSIYDFIDNKKNGLLIEPDNQQQYAELLVELMNNPEKLSILSENAKQSIKKFDVSEIVVEWEHLLQKVYQNEPLH